ncbi:STN domain-containing protein, partial [Sphingomonas sp. 66-10]|uniref:STN domain-containing protein n=1 Tax=Sphingomonas sp. 66-10 TaxID=1895848 RepID=UPI002579DC62
MNRTSTRRMLRVGIASVAIAWGSWVPHARAQTAERAEIRLPRQSLAAALERLSALSKTTILADSALVGERQAPPLNGAYTVEEALEALLRGTGLQYEQVEGGGFVIRAGEPRDRAATSADVIVTGTRIRGAAPAGEHVLTFDRKDIDQSGYATTQQIIQALPQNFGGGLNEG